MNIGPCPCRPPALGDVPAHFCRLLPIHFLFLPATARMGPASPRSRGSVCGSCLSRSVHTFEAVSLVLTGWGHGSPLTGRWGVLSSTVSQQKTAGLSTDEFSQGLQTASHLLQAGPALQERGFLSLGHGRALGLETFLGCHMGRHWRPGLPLTPPAHTVTAVHRESSHPYWSEGERQPGSRGARSAHTSGHGSPTEEEGGLDQSVLACFLYSISSSLLSLVSNSYLLV